MRTYISKVTSYFVVLILLTSCESTLLDNIEVQEEAVQSVQMKNKKGNGTIVPGQQPDDGSIPIGPVNGKYKSIYTYDATGNYYWDLGDGRIYKTVDSIDELDANTLTTCKYEVVYRGDFNGDPFLDSGWIRNNVRCSGFAYKKAQTFNYLIVHETDHRYSPDLVPIWGTWGYLVNTVGGTGNIANPKYHTGS